MIDSFEGEFRWLSNFSPHTVRMGVIVFPTVEHGFVWHKTTDPGVREIILSTPTPGQVKRVGRKLVLRPNWERIKLTTMRSLVELKFMQHEDIRQKLLETGNEQLVEGNHWGDTFWGVCNGVGQNHLGRILMDVRQQIHTDNR